ncbi:hypothetical protein [Streptomyces sp. A0958]|uniref:hypothetical protein n=1 Tax=Streptomyces sp. A0958 TaxID=2563101 RepID=UPI0019D03372|nr:hypothetical protein [Streptomyces sp. A0958]
MNPTTPTTPAAPVAEGDGDGEKTTENLTGTAAKEADQQDLDEAGRGAGTDAELDDNDNDDHDHDHDTDHDTEESSGLAAAAAVVSAGLGVVALTGGWTGRVAAERETLIGQIKTSSGGSAAQQISEIYGDAWHATALVNGLFGLLALLVGCYVLVRPAFGTPAAHPQAGWVRAVAKGGIALGTLGVLISVAMYFDLIVALPTAG